MDVTPLVRKGAQVIQSYAGGKFRVSGQVYESAIAVFPDRTILWQAPDTMAELTVNHFAVFFESGEADVLLLGTGKSFQILNPALRKALKEKGLSVDAMDTGAACRTYNVLMAEGRRVAAALLPAVVF